MKNRTIALVFSIIVLCFAITFHALGWAEPTATPPGGNVYVPINEGDITQTRQGMLQINDTLGVQDLLHAQKNTIAGTQGQVGNLASPTLRIISNTAGTTDKTLYLTADPSGDAGNNSPSITFTLDTDPSNTVISDSFKGVLGLVGKNDMFAANTTPGEIVLLTAGSQGLVIETDGSVCDTAGNCLNAMGGGTITGVTPGPGLSGGGTSGTVTLQLMDCAAGQIIERNATDTGWVCGTDDTGGSGGTGDIDGVTAGSGLGGGGTSGTVTLDINAGDGLRIVSDQVALMDCAAGQIIERNATDTGWICGADDTGGGGSGLWSESGTNIYRNSLVGISNSSPNDALQIGSSSTGGSKGIHIEDLQDAYISIEADRNNDPVGENYNPFIFMSQDGGAVHTTMGHSGGANLSPDGSGYAGAISNAFLIGVNTAHELQLGTGDNVRMTILRDGRIGIGTNSPAVGIELDVVGDIRATGTICDSVGCIGSGGGGYWTAVLGGHIERATGTVFIRDNSVVGQYAVNAASPRLRIYSNTTDGAEGDKTIYMTANDDLGASGNNSPSMKFLLPDDSLRGILGLDGRGNFFASGATQGDMVLTSFNGGDLILGSAAQTRIIIENGGDTGIGITDPSAVLDVAGANWWGGNEGALFVRDTSAVATGVGGMITLLGKYNGNAYTSFAAISAHKDNAMADNYGGGLAFYTRANSSGAWTQKTSARMYITSSGDIGIGETSPSDPLEIRRADWGYIVRGETGGGNARFGLGHDASGAYLALFDNTDTTRTVIDGRTGQFNYSKNGLLIGATSPNPGEGNIVASGSICANGGSNCIGGGMQFIAPVDLGSQLSSGTWVTIDLSGVVPAGTRIAMLDAWVRGDNYACKIDVRKDASQGNGYHLIYSDVAGAVGYGANQGFVELDSNRRFQAYYASFQCIVNEFRVIGYTY